MILKHERHLEEIIQRLIAYGISLHYGKSSVLQEQLEYIDSPKISKTLANQGGVIHKHCVTFRATCELLPPYYHPEFSIIPTASTNLIR